MTTTHKGATKTTADEEAPTLSKMLTRAVQNSTLSVPSSWHQGRTVYGGLTAALALTAGRNVLDDSLPLRAAQFAYTAAVDHPVTTTAQVLNRGKSSANIAARCLSGDTVALNSHLLFARNRASSVSHSLLPAPTVPVAEDCPPALRETDPRPNCAANFDIRLAGAHRILSGQPQDPTLLAWVRHLDATAVQPEIALVAIADSLPPAALVAVNTIAPISTVTWSIHLTRNTPIDPNGWFLIKARSVVAGDGFSFQNQTIWDTDGALLATASQTVAVYA